MCTIFTIPIYSIAVSLSITAIKDWHIIKRSTRLYIANKNRSSFINGNLNITNNNWFLISNSNPNYLGIIRVGINISANTIFPVNHIQNIVNHLSLRDFKVSDKIFIVACWLLRSATSSTGADMVLFTVVCGESETLTLANSLRIMEPRPNSSQFASMSGTASNNFMIVERPAERLPVQIALTTRSSSPIFEDISLLLSPNNFLRICRNLSAI